jgi:hypothetical protein
MVGKWTADALIDSLYHNLIELKCFPFLSDHPHTEECLDLHAVEDVMATDVVTIPEIGACLPRSLHTPADNHTHAHAYTHGSKSHGSIC